jgi:hypothetical protein
MDSLSIPLAANKLPFKTTLAARNHFICEQTTNIGQKPHYVRIKADIYLTTFPKLIEAKYYPGDRL